MEALTAQPIIGQSQLDFNQIAKLVIEHFAKNITDNVLEGIMIFLENYIPKKEKKQEYLNQKEVCERLRISRSTLFKRENKGLIKREASNGRPLYSVEQIEAYLKDTGRRSSSDINEFLNT